MWLLKQNGAGEKDQIKEDWDVWILTCLSLFPAIISDIGYIVLLHIFLNLLQCCAFVLEFEIPSDVVVKV